MFAIADTHAVLWYLLADSRLSENARAAFFGAAEQGNPIGISAISLVEIIYLTEKNRIPPHAAPLLEQELQSSDSVLTVVALDEKFAWSVKEIERSEIPELPDRIIAATADALDLPLITRDHKIRASRVKTIW